MIKLARTLMAAAALVAATAGTASAQFNAFYTRVSFEGAILNRFPGFYVDKFTGNAITTSGASVSSTVGRFSGGAFNDRVDRRSGLSTIWSFVGGTYAFGGEWDLSLDGDRSGQGISFSVNWLGGGSQAMGVPVPNSYTGQFFGFIAAVGKPIADVILSGHTQGASAETYSFDNLTTERIATTVPEPSTYALMAAGLCAVGVLSRRRRA